MIPLLSIQSLNKHYMHNNDKKDIIGNFNLEINRKDFICIVGKSGCGKSSLLRILGGFDTNYEGSISFMDKKITAPSKDSIMIFQDFNQLLPWKNVLENIIFPLTINNKNTSKKILRKEALKYINMVGMSDFLGYYPHQLSGGMKQRAALARALSLQPSILLMDEPFSSLDAITRESLQQLVHEIWSNTNTTIVFVTHDIDEAIKLSNKIVVMDFAPNSVKLIMENQLPTERYHLNTDYLSLYNQIHCVLHDS